MYITHPGTIKGKGCRGPRHPLGAGDEPGIQWEDVRPPESLHIAPQPRVSTATPLPQASKAAVDALDCARRALLPG